jgi:hypothetical protein
VNGRRSVNVATFGSCLSRRTANILCRIISANLISSVYHNRSDCFVGRFIKNNWERLDYAKAIQCISQRKTSSIEDKSDIILRNQCLDHIGLHRLSKGENFIQALGSGAIDYMIMDNYIDLAAKLIHVNSISKDPLFMRPLDLRESIEFTSGDFLEPEDGAANMRKICDFILARSPKTKIFFINFPYNTYSSDARRVERSKKYEISFLHNRVESIPCLDVIKRFQTKDKQHFQEQQYCVYSGMIQSKMIETKK